MSHAITSPNAPPSYSGPTVSALRHASPTHDPHSPAKGDLRAGPDSGNPHGVWQGLGSAKHAAHKTHMVDSNFELREGRVPQAWYSHVQRMLATIALVGLLMAGVEAQILVLTFTAQPSLEQTLAICFAFAALFGTTLAALYAAVTFTWLRLEWAQQATRFEEWVSSSVPTMISWTVTGLVIGVYCGFLAVICFLFATINHLIATICTCVFVVASISPLIWGLYRWLGLYNHTLIWKPRMGGPIVVPAYKADQSDYV